MNAVDKHFEGGRSNSDLAEKALQHTVRHAVSCSGIGLHSGREIRMALKPASAGTGIVFRRTDVIAAGDGEDAALVPARFDAVVDTRMSSVVGNAAGVTVGTIEHLMAALAAREIDNVLIDIDGPEIPVMDGSSQAFMALLTSVGRKRQEAPRRAVRVLREIQVGDDQRFGRLTPADRFGVTFDIHFPNPLIGHQHWEGEIDNALFTQHLARARTFGFREQVEALRRAGLGRGGSLENAVVVDGDRVMNPEGLRFPDEFVRHKVLDVVGDLYLGGPILGHFTGCRSGHDANNQVLRALFADASSYEIVDLPNAEISWASPAAA